MAFGTFVPGHLIPVTFTQTGGAELDLNIKEHNLRLSVMLFDVTGVKSQGMTARLAGKLDANGRIVLDLDLEDIHWFNGAGAVPAIIPGYTGMMFFGVSHEDDTQGVSVPMICEELDHSGSVDKELIWSGTWKMNSLAGDIVYPNL